MTHIPINKGKTEERKWLSENVKHGKQMIQQLKYKLWLPINKIAFMIEKSAYYLLNLIGPSYTVLLYNLGCMPTALFSTRILKMHCAFSWKKYYM